MPHQQSDRRERSSEAEQSAGVRAGDRGAVSAGEGGREGSAPQRVLRGHGYARKYAIGLLNRRSPRRSAPCG
jgi:hypothetical protein